MLLGEMLHALAASTPLASHPAWLPIARDARKQKHLNGEKNGWIKNTKGQNAFDQIIGIKLCKSIIKWSSSSVVLYVESCTMIDQQFNELDGNFTILKADNDSAIRKS